MKRIGSFSSCLSVRRAAKTALVCIAIISVAYVLVSPDLDEMECVVHIRQLGKTATTLAHAPKDPSSAFRARLPYSAPPSILLHPDQLLLLDLICSRLC
jgi:hypothetical protein